MLSWLTSAKKNPGGANCWGSRRVDTLIRRSGHEVLVKTCCDRHDVLVFDWSGKSGRVAAETASKYPANRTS